MPNYDAIYIAAYKNDCKELNRLLDERGVNINQTYQYQYEKPLSVAADAGFYTKRGFGGGLIVFGGVLLLAIPGGQPAGAVLLATTIFSGAGAGILAISEEDLIWHRYQKNGWNALHFAALGNAPEAAIILLNRGISTEATGPLNGKTWTDIAIERTHTNFMKICTKHLRDAEVVQRARANDSERGRGVALAQMNAALEELEARLTEDDEETAPGLRR